MIDRRNEIKIICDAVMLSHIENWMLVATRARRSFPRRWVHSLYFDTPAFDSAHDNLSGIAERSKFRLRWYSEGPSGHGKELAFELKNRSGRLNHKQRIETPELIDDFLGLPLQELGRRLLPGLRKKLPRLPQLNPALQLRYLRDYYEDSQGLRITIDRQIGFFMPIPSAPLFHARERRYQPAIVELKFPPALHAEVAAAMRRLHLTPRRHSKYLAGLHALGLATYL